MLGVVVTVLIATLSIIGFVTADELGGFALIVGAIAWAVLGAPLFIAAAIGAELDVHREQKRAREGIVTQGSGARSGSAKDARAASEFSSSGE